MYPFKQIRKNDTIIREFTADVSSEELVWHRDLFDRRVQALEGNEWYIQIDNQLPKKIIEGKTYFIPAHNYHRLIKGKGKLVVSIQENKENTMKITKRQLRRIIKEEYSKLKRQRMSESVMSMIHIEIQNAIAEAVDDLTMDPAPHGTTIEDIHMYIDGSNIQFSHGYVPDMEEIEQIVYDMVDAGDLVDDGRGYLMLPADNSTY